MAILIRDKTTTWTNKICPIEDTHKVLQETTIEMTTTDQERTCSPTGVKTDLRVIMDLKVVTHPISMFP